MSPAIAPEVLPGIALAVSPEIVPEVPIGITPRVPPKAFPGVHGAKGTLKISPGVPPGNS